MGLSNGPVLGQELSPIVVSQYWRCKLKCARSGSLAFGLVGLARDAHFCVDMFKTQQWRFARTAERSRDGWRERANDMSLCRDAEPRHTLGRCLAEELVQRRHFLLQSEARGVPTSGASPASATGPMTTQKPNPAHVLATAKAASGTRAHGIEVSWSVHASRRAFHELPPKGTVITVLRVAHLHLQACSHEDGEFV